MLGFLILASLISLIAGQPTYVPQPIPFSSCPNGGRLVTFGNSTLPGSYSRSTMYSYYLTTSPFAVTDPTQIYQLSFGVYDNVIANVAHLRLGLFEISGTSLNLLSQSDEIQLFSTAADTIYADLPAPAALMPNVQYAVGVMTDASSGIITGVNYNDMGGGLPLNQAYVSYSSASFASSGLLEYQEGRRPLQATGCVPTSNPFTAPNIQIYSMCFWSQSVAPPKDITNSEYARETFTISVGGAIAVSGQGGTTSVGTWQPISAAQVNAYSSNNGPYYYPGYSGSKYQTLGLGTSGQMLFPSGSSYVDSNGISFVAGDQTTYTIFYSNNSYQVAITKGLGGVSSTTNAVTVGSGFTLTPITSLSQVSACNPPTVYTPDPVSCNSGEVPVSFGDDNRQDADSGYTGEYSYGNIVFFREFTANTAYTTLKQLTFLVDANPNAVIKLRMGLFTADSPAFAMPSYTLVEQTREITLTNAKAGIVAINLLNPVTLVMGQNYTIGVVSDQYVLSTMNYAVPSPYFDTVPYQSLMKPGFPTSMSTSYTLWSLPLGANGCAARQTTKQVQMCATFVYGGSSPYTTIYSGVLTVLVNPDTPNAFVAISGTGTSVFDYGYAQYQGAWTLHNYYLPSDNIIYAPAGNGGIPLDQQGITILVNSTYGEPEAIAVQIFSYLDPVSSQWRFQEYQQYYYTTIPTAYVSIVSGVSFSDYTGTLAQCTPPPRPTNLVSPPSSTRKVCPKGTMSQMFGDSNVGDFARHSEGTTILANKIYTYSISPISTATISQIAVGLLRNTDRAGQISVRMGIYAASTNSLLGQSVQLNLTQVVDQLIIMDLPTPIQFVAGQNYYLALLADSPLEVATTDVQNSPSMSYTFSAAGLPGTFASSGANDVSISIAAYGCISATHSFCSYYQYYVPTTRTSVTYLYQGLIQASSTQQSNSFGTYSPVPALVGRLTSYIRSSGAPTSAVRVTTFALKPGTTPSMYAGAQAIDTTGWNFAMADGTTSRLYLDSTTGKLDESYRSASYNATNLLYSGFLAQPIAQGIASCGLSILPQATSDNVAPPTCPAGESLVTYGDAFEADLDENTEGVYYAPASTIFLRQITTNPTRGTILSQIKLQVNVNLNTVNRQQFGLYDANFTLMATTPMQTTINPYDQLSTAVFATPQYLAPNTVYYLAWWTENAVYAGFSSIEAPAGSYHFSSNWPTYFEDNSANSQRPISGVGCTTPATAQPGSPSGSADSSTSSGNLGNGAVAGIVIGCVVGSNLILLACLYVCCIAGGAGGKKGSWTTDHSELEESRATNPSRVELGEMQT